MAAPELSWLPEPERWRERLAALASWEDALRLANCRLDFLRTNALDQMLRRRSSEKPEGFAGREFRLAALSSSTFAHLIPALRIAALRAGLWLDVYEGDYGQYRQALEEPGSSLHGFRPQAVLFAFDAETLCADVGASSSANAVDAALGALRDDLVAMWRQAQAMGALVLQQTALPSAPPLMGSAEHRLSGSRAAFLARVNVAMRDWADEAGVDIVALDAACARDGVGAWRDAALWARAKQDVKPPAAPMYGELVVRTLCARLGRSRKCLVLDLDNTLWGGVIGDDGLDGVVLGQGSALGEGFVAVQTYARELSRRGIILAVCSKNDEANALESFDKHPDMVLRRKDIACFVANWDDKAANIARIAQRLNIGLDSLVFLDDNPFERTRVREALPMVGVPEVPDDPALVPDALAAAGYFESVGVTGEDRARVAQYTGNAEREAARASHSDMASYLKSLEMRAIWGEFDSLNKQRIVQLINKTNQFNLTTRRYGDAEYDAFARDGNTLGLHMRLIDRLGDNGLVVVVIGRQDGEALVIDTWLMSCRVLGRGVEAATLALLVAQARRRSVVRLIGEYAPTSKNGMVSDHYDRLGFTPLDAGRDGARRYELRLADYVALETSIALMKGADGAAGSFAGEAP